MNRLSTMSDELKKYFIPIGERTEHRTAKWKCNIEDCKKILNIGERMEHLKYNHLTTFQNIDNKLPIKDISKKRQSGSKFKCIMCGEEFSYSTNFSSHRRLYTFNIF
uniref:C2H2-type domain-containing protein n=1 Tax=Meloidogyne hapla TaxID=6305 RepID=A0A1I8C0H4_MELHA